MRNIFFLVFVFSSVISWSQQIEKNRGTMPTRVSNSGEATYYYITNEQNREIKQGRFDYRLRESRGFSKLYQDVEGDYQQGLKEGRWTYRTSFRDYKADRETDYLTGIMTLSAEYTNGIPDGAWKFSYTYKTRDIESNVGGRVKWSKYNPSKQVTLHMRFDNFQLCDTLYLVTDDGRAAEGVFDRNGFFNGCWNFEFDNRFVRELYDDGLLYKREIYNKEDTLLIKTQDYSDIEMTRRDHVRGLIKEGSRIDNLHYTLDTSSLSRNNHIIPQILYDWLWDNPYLLFRDLDGDNFNHNKTYGAFQVLVVNQITPAQQDKLTQLEVLHEDFKQINIRVHNITRGKSLSNRTKSTMELMGYYERMAEKYVCLAKSLTSMPDFTDGQKQSVNDCINTVKLTESLPVFHSRDEALHYFIENLSEKAETMHSYEEMLKREVANH